ncbi:hypothetical protein [Sideroxydans lithotrophicus]|uniref:Rad50/SbcC-type AAA domain-containing protein n=1 Tax=Sideroxydans lithotrophicus (strain ES-1) TaxID=580332 RepID=D5CQV3_SIDLE|nr:hypothetical protein [Sideroxydans lithotrophicus]ADE11339.1 conserved hypothetical protein [Sideroxydans lithotrophicus ES-1]
MRFRRLTIRLQTNDGPYGVTLDFPDGLVVMWADNSMGKSTCVKSILVALGMEAMLTTQQSDLPLPPAVKARLDSDNGEHDVIESEVFLELENQKAERIVVQRTIKGSRDKNLITVHEGPILTSPGQSVSSRDYFVNRQGAATRESGFHFFLSNFFGWQLPQVQTYDGNEYPLYLQCVMPYFAVEQTRGWSTVQPPLPTHFRIREAHKRAVEFILNLDAHRNALKRQEIDLEITRIAVAWAAQVGRANELAEQKAVRVQALPQKPTATWPPLVTPSLMAPVGSEWISIRDRADGFQAELDNLVKKEIPRVNEIASSAQAELTAAEEVIQDKQTLLSRLLESFAMEQQEVERIEERLKAIAEDIQRNKDIRVLKNLGSRQGSAVDGGSCPICHQSIHDTLVPIDFAQTVMSLDESIDFLSEQRRTYEVVLANAANVVDSRSLQISTLREEVSTARQIVRALRQTLVSDGRQPSIAAIQAQIRLENSVANDRDAQSRFEKIVNGFGELADSWKIAQEEALKLPKDDVSEDDRKKIGIWTRILRDQLSQYGFGSFPETQIVISTDTYRPEHEGFDLEASFPLQNSISASDLIRTIWAYLNGLLEIARTEDTHHPGCIIFDEPRQQSTRDVSFGELLKRASLAGNFSQQVIFFTSENRERLKGHLSGLPHYLNEIEGRVLKKIPS